MMLQIFTDKLVLRNGLRESTEYDRSRCYQSEVNSQHLTCYVLQLDAINQTVENMQALVEDVRSRDTRRNDEFHEFMDKVDRQVSYQDSLKEMLPALERFCSDYIHKEIQLVWFSL